MMIMVLETTGESEGPGDGLELGKHHMRPNTEAVEGLLDVPEEDRLLQGVDEALEGTAQQTHFVAMEVPTNPEDPLIAFLNTHTQQIEMMLTNLGPADNHPP